MFQPDFNSAVKVIDSAKGNGTYFETVQYEHLKNHYSEKTTNYVEKLRQVRIKLTGGEICTEAGALQFMKGNVTMKVDSSASSIAKGFLSSTFTGEASVKPKYSGEGEVYLEPQFSHFLMIVMDNDEVICDKGAFYCCESSIQVGVHMHKTLSGNLASGEGSFQTKLKGSGVAIIESPVPAEQILIYELNNEKLQVDGNYSILRRGNIEFTVEKSTKSIIGTLKGGEGLLQTYKGTGEVWLIPTMKFI